MHMKFDLFDWPQPGNLLLKLSRPSGTIQNLIHYTAAESQPEDNRCVAGGDKRELSPFESGVKSRLVQ